MLFKPKLLKSSVWDSVLQVKIIQAPTCTPLHKTGSIQPLAVSSAALVYVARIHLMVRRIAPPACRQPILHLIIAPHTAPQHLFFKLVLSAHAQVTEDRIGRFE